MSDVQKKNSRKEYFKKYREEHREELREYQKQWRADNKDKVDAIQARYWNKKSNEKD